MSLYVKTSSFNSFKPYIKIEGPLQILQAMIRLSQETVVENFESDNIFTCQFRVHFVSRNLQNGEIKNSDHGR